ncbi:protein-glutamate O-methyltransferase CheR [Vibrio kyushuensis]|uniref:CheR family methyltransferase n=1 Tax=Vibrio TaxID=662 RepID=UPI003D0EA88A
MAKVMSDEQFVQIQKLVEAYTGIHLASHKRSMVENRLQARLATNQCDSFNQYLSSLADHSEEGEFWQFIDKMTTHETSFFREEYQFEALCRLLPSLCETRQIKVWSAACSTGEEAYTLAMVLQNVVGSGRWSLLGTDISELAIEQAKRCQYDLSLAEKIPSHYRRAYCLKGVGSFSDHFTLIKALRNFCHFQSHNLLQSKGHNLYDIIFLRNILIYFPTETQLLIVNNILSALKVSGFLFLGHSENVLRDNPNVELIDNCIYRKVAHE